jgi:DNA repair protein RadC
MARTAPPQKTLVAPPAAATHVAATSAAATRVAVTSAAATHVTPPPRATKPRKPASHTPPAGTAKSEADARHHRLVARALRSLESRAREPGITLSNARVLADWFRLRLAECEQEVFAAAWLDNRLRLISFEALFHGTHDRTQVHIREVVKAALRVNAAAVAFAHNHPSGCRRPSPEDIALNEDLRYGLALVGVRLIDHFVIAQAAPPRALPRGGVARA